MNNDKLFYLIWRNIVLRSKIIGYLSFYNLHSAKRYIKSIDDLKSKEAQLCYRSVELQLTVIRNEHDKKLSLEMLESLPNSVTIVSFTGYGFGQPVNLIESLPSNVTSLNFDGLYENTLQITGQIPNTLKTLKLGSRVYNKLEFDSSGNQSLTNLDVGTLISCQKTGALPSSLIKYKCSSGNLKSFNIESLSLSLSNLTSLDFSGTELTKFINNDKGRNVSNLSSLVNLKYLDVGQHFNNIMPFGYLPNGLQTLVLPFHYNTNNIKVKSLPDSITKLCFQPPPTLDYYNPKVKWIPSNKLHKIHSNILPLSLVKLNMGSNHILEMEGTNLLNKFNKITFTSYTINKSTIPQSITKLKVLSYSNILISVPVHIESLSLNGNIKITNSKELTQLTKIKIVNGWLSNCYSVNSPLKTIMCNSINVKVELNNSVKSLSTMNYQLDMVISNSLILLEYTTSSPVDTFLLPPSINTLIIRSAPNILLPLSPNIKTIYINSSSHQLLQNLNLFKNTHLLKVFKVIDIPYGPCTNIFKKISSLQ